MTGKKNVSGRPCQETNIIVWAALDFSYFPIFLSVKKIILENLNSRGTKTKFSNLIQMHL